MKMAYERLDWPNLEAIWISHFHMDHCGGLGPLLAGTKHAAQMKARTKPLKIFGPKGIEKLVNAFNDVHNYRLLEQPFEIEILEVEPLEEFEIVRGVQASAMETPHTAESLAIRIREGANTLVYSADTAPSDELADFASSVDMFVLECTYPKNKPAKKHLELSEAIEMIRRSSARRAMLTHFYPEWDNVDFNTEVARYKPPCEVIEAKDGLTLSF